MVNGKAMRLAITTSSGKIQSNNNNKQKLAMATTEYSARGKRTEVCPIFTYSNYGMSRGEWKASRSHDAIYFDSCSAS